MRIGVMLRCIDEHGGIGVYAGNIVEELLKIDPENHYVLFFRSHEHVARYAPYPNTTSVLLRSRSKAVWDQVKVPLAARRERVDLLFNPKFTLPLLGRARAVMVVHGADWFLPDHKKLYSRLDRLYMRLMMPLYFRRADRVISASEFSTRGFVEHVKGSASKLRTIHYCGSRAFGPLPDEDVTRVLDRYGLQEPFLLTAIHYDTGRKNFANMARAYAMARARGVRHTFVVCGRDVERYARELPLQEMGIAEHVRFQGWVEQRDLPALYNAADLYLYPTRLEGFPIPITEALACGCPIVTSKGGVFPEAAGEAALYVDPENPAEIANAMCRVLGDEGLRRRLRRKGLERAERFTWDRCAARTLELFRSVCPLVPEEGARRPAALLADAPPPR